MPDLQSVHSFYRSLTTRQRQVVALVTQGKTNRQIAHDLCIEPCVVAEHLTNIYDRVHVFIGVSEYPRPNRVVVASLFAPMLLH